MIISDGQGSAHSLLSFFLPPFSLWTLAAGHFHRSHSLEKDGAECKSTTLSKAHLRRHQGWLWLTTLSLLGTTRWWCTCKSLNLASSMVRCIPLLFLTSRKCFLSLLLGWPKNWGFVGVFPSHLMKNPNKFLDYLTQFAYKIKLMAYQGRH